MTDNKTNSVEKDHISTKMKNEIRRSARELLLDALVWGARGMARALHWFIDLFVELIFDTFLDILVCRPVLWIVKQFNKSKAYAQKIVSRYA